MKNFFFKRIIALLTILGSINFLYAAVIPLDTSLIANNWDKRINADDLTAIKPSSECTVYEKIASYEWDRVFFRVLQPLVTTYKLIQKNGTVSLYNPDLFQWSVDLNFASNIMPKKTDSGVGNDEQIVLTALSDVIFKKPSIARWLPAWQIVLTDIYRSLFTRDTDTPRSFFFMNTNFETITPSIKTDNMSDWTEQKTSCLVYYVGYCGDGVVDKRVDWCSNTDWCDGIQTQDEWFVKWYVYDWGMQITPNEVCDDGDQNWQPGKCKTDCSGIWDGTETGNMIVTKTLTVEQNYAPEQELQFRINFSNPGSQILENVSIEDFLPSGLEYISSEIHWVTNSLFSTGDAWWSLRIAYTGFNLAAGQNWYILINAKLLACNAALNIVNRSALINWQTISGNTSKQVVCGTTPVSITKTANLRTVQWGQTVRFTITVNNATPNTINDVFVQDIWPVNGCVFMTGTAETSLPTTQTQNWNLTQWWVPWWLIPGQNLTISFLWQTKTDASCVWTHTNTWKVLYWTEQQETNTTVTISQASHNVSIQKTVIQQWFWPWDPVRYEIKYRNNWSITINSLTIKDYRPSSLDFVESTPWPNSIVSPELQTPIVWNITTPLQPNEERSIIINGKIKTTIQ